MVSGPPWSPGRSSPKSDRPLSPLAPDEIDRMLALYRALYGA